MRVAPWIAVLPQEGGGGGHSMMRLYPGRSVGSVMIVNATMMKVRKTMHDVDRDLFLAAAR